MIGYSFRADEPDICIKLAALAYTYIDGAPSSPLIQRRMWQTYPDDYGANHGPDAKEAFIQLMEMGWEDLSMVRMAIGWKSAMETLKPWTMKFMNHPMIEWGRS